MVKRVEVVAERLLWCRVGGKKPAPVKLSFERPIEKPAGEWSCTYRIDGTIDLGAWERSKEVSGVDSVQALQLAMAHVDRILLGSDAFQHGAISWSPDGGTYTSADARPPFPPLGRRFTAAEVVRTVELQLDGPGYLVLRIEVLRTEYGPLPMYWTRVWRSDTYRVEPTASASVRGRKRYVADETVLVEDVMFSEGPVKEATANAAFEATLARIRWQLFKGADEPKIETPSATRRPPKK